MRPDSTLVMAAVAQLAGDSGIACHFYDEVFAPPQMPLPA